MAGMRQSLTVIISILSILVFVKADTYDACKTPSGAPGECKTITDCASLYNIIQQRPISAPNADLLRRSQCGFSGKVPKACCPSDASPQNTHHQGGSYNGGDLQTNSLLPSTDVCGVDTQHRILGGEKADLDEFPWMVLLEYERSNGDLEFYCGGVVISKRYILTAAHCLKGKDLPKSWKLVSVRLGEYNTDTDVDCVKDGKRDVCAPPAVNISVEERISHEDYDAYDINQYHDIALLRLAKDIQFTDYVKPICLPGSEALRKKEYTDKNLIVAGWGKTGNGFKKSNIKLKLEVPVNDKQECTRTYRQASVQIGDGQLCAGGKMGKDSCGGDSGGPLMNIEANGNQDINWYCIGVVSFGPTACGTANWPGVYTKVANYVPWILKNIRA